MKMLARILLILIALLLVGATSVEALSISRAMAPAVKFENLTLNECLERMRPIAEKENGYPEGGPTIVFFGPKAVALRRVTVDLPAGRLEDTLRAIAEQAGCELRLEYAYFIAEKGIGPFPPVRGEKGAEKLSKALEELIPQRIEFREATFSEAVKYLSQRTRQLAATSEVALPPNGPGGFLIEPPTGSVSGHRVSIRCGGISVLEVCHYLGGLTGLQVTVAPGGVSFSPASGLSALSQDERDAAAKKIRETYVPTPKEKWEAALAPLEALESGAAATAELERLGATYEGRARSGKLIGGDDIFRLDPEWIVTCTLVGIGIRGEVKFGGHKLRAIPQHFWVGPPPDFTGVWTTYYANGQRRHAIEYGNGKYSGRFTSFHPDGSETAVQHYRPASAEGEGAPKPPPQ